MRTTLDIENSVLAAVKELAQRQGKTAGAVVSELVRQALMQSHQGEGNEVREPAASYGFKPLPAGDALVTNELVDKLREDLGV